MSDWWTRQSPYNLLIFAAFLWLKTLVEVCIGKARGRFGPVVYLDKEPKQFWAVVVMEFLCGVGLLGYYLYLDN